MESIKIYKGSTGLNDLVNPVRQSFNPENGITELEECVNMDVDDTGRVYMRNGYSLLQSGVYHSLYCAGGDCFVVSDRTSDSAIWQVGTDYSLTGIRSSLTKSARISFWTEGAKTYYVNGAQSGVIESAASSAWPVQTHVGATTTRAFQALPSIATHIAVHKGRMWVVSQDVVYVSEPYAFGKFDMARRFYQFGTNVLMVKPVENGVWVSDLKRTGFIQDGEKFDDAKFIPKLEEPAHEWSENIELVDLSQSRFQIPGLCAVWSCDSGLCIGSGNGDLIIATEDKLAYNSGSMGATLVNKWNVINSVY